jgi:hypothetical protein
MFRLLFAVLIVATPALLLRILSSKLPQPTPAMTTLPLSLVRKVPAGEFFVRTAHRLREL